MKSEAEIRAEVEICKQLYIEAWNRMEAESVTKPGGLRRFNSLGKEAMGLAQRIGTLGWVLGEHPELPKVLEED